MNTINKIKEAGDGACSRNHRLDDLESSRYTDDPYRVNAVITPVGYKDINGVALPAGYYLHSGHTWVKIGENHIVKIGVDDFAARLFGCFDQVDTPEEGKRVVQGKAAIRAARQGRHVFFASPVTGVVMQVNPAITDEPERINRAPYSKGWILEVYCPHLVFDLKHLAFTDYARDLVQESVDRLYRVLEQESGLMAADGGRLSNDIFGSVPQLSWNRLVDLFISNP